MSSIIPGYEYDIFISYRQKDNKYDGWVSEFVDKLKKELEATFKEELSVYFDINPHDGLLESHDVDASLEEKLKCLVFIPILSRTYCDPGCFAWEHEFKAFVEQASQDSLGLKVRLPGRNVASRVLPVRIHDLEKDDIELCESLMGGSLRCIDFIYKEQGVNRPLRPNEEDPHNNFYHTVYRNQLNKVALAIKEILSGIKSGSERIEPEETLAGKEKVKESGEQTMEAVGEKFTSGHAKLFKSKTSKLLTAATIIMVFIIAAIIAYPGIFRKDRLERLRTSGEKITIAVMPFQNMTNDTLWNIWQGGIQDMLINKLSNSEELKVRQADYINKLVRSEGIVNYSSLTPLAARDVSRKMNANVMINGNIKQAGDKVRLYAQLIDPGTEEVYKSFHVEGGYMEENIFLLIDSLSGIVRNFLIISELEKELPVSYRPSVTTDSPDAYRYYVRGRNYFANWNFLQAIDCYTKALAIDSGFITAITAISISYGNQFEIEFMYSSAYESLYLYDLAKEWCLLAREKTDQMTGEQKININWIYAAYSGSPNDEIKYLKQLIESDDMSPNVYTNLGSAYNKLFQYYEAIPYFEKALEIYETWDVKPLWSNNYAYLGDAYHETGQYRKAEKLYKKAEKDFPDNPLVSIGQSTLSATLGDTVATVEHVNKAMALGRSMSIPEACLTGIMASCYNKAGVPDKAEEYYRQAFSMDPGNPDRINDLAYFLIDSERGIDEGLELADRRLALVPEDFFVMHTKGYGLYKQGKYREALELLQESWDLRMERAVYDHKAFLHLEAAKKAVTEQNKN
jgi:tetratricopeptide (TPR) repeat protein